MKAGPNLANIAALIGDRARADMLAELMSGKALTATELSHAAQITKQTASAHLAKLMDRGLIVQEKQGRHRYFRLANSEVAAMLESLMNVAQRLGSVRLLTGPSEPALRQARVCYDHLAGDVGVKVMNAVQQKRLLNVVGEGAELTLKGERFFTALGIDMSQLQSQRRPLCRLCLDWSERRHHLAGSLGAALLQLYFKNRWAQRVKGSRIVALTPQGLYALRDQFGVRVQAAMRPS